MTPQEIDEFVKNLEKTLFRLLNIITRARQISPEVAARIDEIINEEYPLGQTNE